MVIEKRSGHYRARINFRGRYVASRTFLRKGDAQAWERDAKTALASGTWVDPHAHELVTVSDWVTRWLETKEGGKPSAILDRKSIAKNHVLPVFGRLPLAAVRPSAVAEWAIGLTKTHSPSTARRALAVLRNVFNLAIADGAAVRNPAVGIRLPSQQPGEPFAYSHEQVAALVREMPTERDKVLVLVLAYGGPRWGEVTALRPASIREDGTVRLSEAWAETNGKLYLGDLKTHAARTIVLPNLIFSRLVEWSQTKPDQNSLLFHGSNPKAPLRTSNWTPRVLIPAIERANLPRITPHNLRDTAASLAIQAGASVATVSRLLGHQDATTTLRHYATFFPSDLDTLASRLDAYIRLDDGL